MSLGLPVASGPYGAIHYQINTRRDAGDAWSATSIAPQGHHYLVRSFGHENHRYRVVMGCAEKGSRASACMALISLRRQTRV